MFERATSIYKKFDGILDESPVTSKTPSDFVKPSCILEPVDGQARVNLDDYIKLEKKIHELQRYARSTHRFKLKIYSVRDFEKRKARNTIIILTCIVCASAILALPRRALHIARHHFWNFGV